MFSKHVEELFSGTTASGSNNNGKILWLCWMYLFICDFTKLSMTLRKAALAAMIENQTN